MKRIVAFVLGTAMVCGMLDGISFEATAQTNVFSAPTQDITIPFIDTMEDDFKTDKIFLLFKYDYTHDEIEETIIPELLSQIGTDKIISIWDEYEANGQIITLNPDNGESETRRYQYIADLNLDEADKESAYEIAMSLYESGYFYSVEMNMIGIPDDIEENQPKDISLPFTARLEDDFKSNKILLLFKYDYTHDEIEEMIIPELLTQIGTDKIVSIWDEYEANGQIITLNPDNGESETRRYQYIADLNLDEADKESAYEIAMSLYESGYFYSVEMNMIGISGDATCDNSVDVCDAVLIARFLAEDSEASMTEQGRRNADYNADGDITPDDIALILKKIARLI